MDSGFGSYWKQRDNARSTTRHYHTPWYSLDAIKRLEGGGLEDAPLSDCGGNSDEDQEMASADDGAEEATGTNPIRPSRQESAVTGPAVNLAGVPEAPLMANLADTDDEKAHRDAFHLIMQGFHTMTRTLSDEYQQACMEVQSIVQKSLRKSTAIDRTFVWGASATIHQWVRAVHPAMDCMGESMEEQSCLLQEAQKAGKEAMEDISALLPAEENLYLPPVIPQGDILTPALTAARNHRQKVIEAVNVQLSALVHRHIRQEQARVFLASLLQVMCSYWQEMDGMATSQVILPGQIVPNLWGVSWGVMEGLFLLGPPTCSASWPACLVEWVTAESTNKTAPVVPTTPAKLNTPGSGKGKPPLGSSSKKSGPSKQVTAYWKDPERDREDVESCRQEEERHQKKPSGPVLYLDDHEEPVAILTSKAALSWVFQAPNLPTRVPSEGKKGRGKVRQASPIPFNSSDDEPLLDKGGEPEPKSQK